jgi:hypothetical protein
MLLALALLGGGIWWGIVILLETPQGTLRIESEVGQVRIELLDAEDRVQELQIDRGDNETTLRAGQYRLRLAGEHDAVAISPSTITLRKGEQQVARITRLDAAPAEPPVRKSDRGRSDCIRGHPSPYGSGSLRRNWHPFRSSKPPKPWSCSQANCLPSDGSIASSRSAGSWSKRVGEASLPAAAGPVRPYPRRP